MTTTLEGQSAVHDSSTLYIAKNELEGASKSDYDDSTTSKLADLPQRQFFPGQCLFCSQTNLDLESNLAHMLKAHGLFIPERERLVVDMETLVAYFHLIIFDYFECLHCGSRRHSAEAAQQHMIAKGHCKFDLYNEESEFRDFYDFDSENTSDGKDADDVQSSADEDEAEHKNTDAVSQLDKNRISNFTKPDATTLRLASGKLLSHRSSGKPRQSRQRPSTKRDAATLQVESGPETAPSPSTAISGSSSPAKALTKSEKRDSAFINTQLSRLRLDDRRSLMHLPTSQQRAILLTQAKQLDKARRAERASQNRVQLAGNKHLMDHVILDVSSFNGHRLW